MVGIAVAGKEALQPDDIRAVRGPDQRWTAGAKLDQCDAAQDQGPHDPFAQFGFGDHQRAYTFRRNDQRFHVGDRMHVDQYRTAGQLTDLSDEVASPFLDDRREMSERVAARDGNRTGNECKHAR